MKVKAKTEELEAIEVTNLEDAAEFCGTVVSGETVRVKTPNGFLVNARVGDYIVDTGDGCDVYSADAFSESFEVVDE